MTKPEKVYILKLAEKVFNSKKTIYTKKINAWVQLSQLGLGLSTDGKRFQLVGDSLRELVLQKDSSSLDWVILKKEYKGMVRSP